MNLEREQCNLDEIHPAKNCVRSKRIRDIAVHNRKCPICLLCMGVPSKIVCKNYSPFFRRSLTSRLSYVKIKAHLLLAGIFSFRFDYTRRARRWILTKRKFRKMNRQIKTKDVSFVAQNEMKHQYVSTRKPVEKYLLGDRCPHDAFDPRPDSKLLWPSEYSRFQSRNKSQQSK